MTARRTLPQLPQFPQFPQFPQLPLLPVLLLLAASCSEMAEPHAPVTAAVERARMGDLDGFADCFTPESASLIAMFWSVSTRYGYLDEDSLRYLADAEITGTEPFGDRARIDIRTGERDGSLCVVRTESGWRVDLLSSQDCRTPATPPDEVTR